MIVLGGSSWVVVLVPPARAQSFGRMSWNVPLTVKGSLLRTSTFTPTGSPAKAKSSRIFLLIWRFVWSISATNLMRAYTNELISATLNTQNERLEKRTPANAHAIENVSRTLPNDEDRKTTHSLASAVLLNSPLGTATVDRMVSVRLPLVIPPSSASGESISL